MNVYESVIKNSNIIMFIVNPDGIVIDTNRYTSELLEDTNIIGKYFYSIIDECSQVSVRSILIQKQENSIEASLRIRYGGSIPVFLNVAVIDTFLFIIGFMKDPRGDKLANSEVLADSSAELVEYDDKRQWQLRNIDTVTGLYNKEFFKSIFKSMYDKALVTGGNVGIICFDIQGFDEMAGLYGEEKCNSILSGLSQVMLTSTRSTDYAVKYDDKFVVLVPNTKKEVLQKISERIRNAAQNNLDVSLNSAWGCTLGNGIEDDSQIIKMVIENTDSIKSGDNGRLQPGP